MCTRIRLTTCANIEYMSDLYVPSAQSEVSPSARPVIPPRMVGAENAKLWVYRMAPHNPTKSLTLSAFIHIFPSPVNPRFAHPWTFDSAHVNSGLPS